jgi:hypothetical protein
LFLGLSRGAPARAELVEPTNFYTHPVAVYAQLGLGTPPGLGGLEIEPTVLQHFVLSSGIGLDPSGLQVAFMPRLRLPVSRREALTFGLGGSIGEYRLTGDPCGADCTPAVHQGTAVWANLEAAAETRLSAGFSLRLFVGAGRTVLSELRCVQPGTIIGCSPADSPIDRVFAGGAVGWAF